MTNPTTPFSWQMPTATDLVTDLPADFETFGQAVATSMADLLGGTTGQVLAKASNTNMDFSWVTTDDANAIQNSIVDAKGDLIAASANDTPARLAVGANGETLVADSSTSTGLRYTAGTVQSNPVLNSAFQVWQRGTSIAQTASTKPYTADRWQAYNGANQAITISRQATGDTTNLPFIQYCARFQRNLGQTGTADAGLFQSFESVNVVPFAGKTITLSFYARRGANYSATSNILIARMYSGTGTDGNILTGFAGSSTFIDQNPVLTTTWQRFSYTATVATNASELAIGLFYQPTGTAGAADFFEATGVQVDIGSVALPFRTYAGTIQGELAACQRYYYRTVPGSFSPFGSGVNLSTTNSNVVIPYPVTMRTAPSALEQTGTASDYRMSHTTATTCSSVPVFAAASANQAQVNFTVSAGLLSGGGVIGQSNASTSYLGWSAEL